MNFPFSFIVLGYDKYGTQKHYLEHGVGICKGYKDAIGILEERFKDELIAIKHLELYEYSPVISLPYGTYEEVIDCLESGENFDAVCDPKGNKLKE